MLSQLKRLIYFDFLPKQPTHPKIGSVGESEADAEANCEKEETSNIYREGASAQIPEAARQLLENYSGIPSSNNETHAHNIVSLVIGVSIL